MKNKFKIGLLLVFLSGLLSYVNILNNEFVFDDSSTIENNSMIKNLKNIPLLFTRDYFRRAGVGDFTLSGESSYRPVVTLSYFIDYFVWKEKSFGFHLTNLILHLLNVLVLFGFIYNFTENNRVSLIAGILFSLNPILTEAVNCVSFREDILCALFFYAGLYFYIINKIKFKMLLIGICYILSIFSKEMGIVFFPIVIVLDFYAGKQLERSILPDKRKALYLMLGIITLFYLSVRFYFMKNNADKELNYLGNNFFTNILLMMNIFMYYLNIILYPVNLCVDYVISIPVQIFNFRLIGSFLIILTLFIVSFINSLIKKSVHSKFFFFLLLYFISLVPVSNVIPIKNVIAERYLYLPYGFFAIVFSMLFFKEKYYESVKLVAVIIIIVIYSTLTLARNEIWNNGFTLWTQTLKINPYSFHAHNNLASYYDDKKNYTKSEFHYKTAIKLRPYDPIPYYNLGNTYKSQGEPLKALEFYKESIKRDPTIIEPYINIGITYVSLKMLDEAEHAFRKAVEVNKSDSSAHNNLAAVLGEKGRVDEAIKEHITAIKLDKNNQNAYFNLGLCFMDKKNYTKAVSVFNKLLKLNPEYYNAYYYAGKCYESMGDKDMSAKYFEKYKKAMNPKNY